MHARSTRWERVLLGVALLLLLRGCGGGAGGGSRSVGGSTVTPSPGHITIGGHPATAGDTVEGAGALRVPLLGLVIENRHPTHTFSLGSILFHAGGDFDVVSGLALFQDPEGDARLLPGESPIWTGLRFGSDGQRLASLGVVSIPPGVSHLLLTGDIDPAALAGSVFRVWVDAGAGDLGFPFSGSVERPGGRADSGERYIDTIGMAVLERGEPRRRPFADPGMSDLPALAAALRLTSVESGGDFVLEMAASGPAVGWSEIRWSLWVDGDADGARLSAADVPVVTGLVLDPAAPASAAWPGPLPAGGSESFLITADLLPTAPPEGIFEISLSIVDARGLSSGGPLILGSTPVTGGLRIGTRGVVVLVGDDLAVVDPTFDATLVHSVGGWDSSGGLVVDPDGRWVAIGSRTPAEIRIIDLRGLREIGRVTLLAPPVSMALSPAGDVLYASLDNLRGVVEVDVDLTTGGGSVRRYFLPGKIHGELYISPGGDELYLAQPHGVVPIIDTSSGRKVGRIDGPEPQGGVLHPDGDPLLLIGDDGRLHRFPTGGGDAVSTGLPGLEVSVSEDGTEVYLLTDIELQVLDPATFAFAGFRSYLGNPGPIFAGLVPGRVLMLEAGGTLQVLDRGEVPRRIVPDTPLDVWALELVR